jgi:hypothetical protein
MRNSLRVESRANTIMIWISSAMLAVMVGTLWLITP